MREIKFRAWDEHLNKMWSAEEIGKDELTLNPDGRGFVNVNSTSIKLSTYMEHLIPLQFTGLKDKNDKEIYEGDIVKFYIKTIEYIGKVVFEKGAFIIACDKLTDSYVTFIEVDDEELCLIDMEIIGNIYKNPELLKKKLGLE